LKQERSESPVKQDEPVQKGPAKQDEPAQKDPEKTGGDKSTGDTVPETKNAELKTDKNTKEG
jgi:ubiquitin